MLLEQADFAETGERHGSAGLHVCAIMEGAGQECAASSLRRTLCSRRQSSHNSGNTT